MLPFEKPDDLTLREQEMEGIKVYRLGKEGQRFELNVMVGPLLSIAKIATQTGLKYYPPEGKEITTSELASVAKMLLGSLAADAVMEAEDLQLHDEEESEGKTEKGLTYFHHGFSVINGGVQGTTILLPEKGAQGAVIAFRAAKESLAEAKKAMQAIVDTFNGAF